MKKLLFPLILLLGSMVFTGCSKEEDNHIPSNTDNKAEKVTLQMLVFANEGMMKNYQEILNRYEEQNQSVDLNLVNVYGDDWSDFELSLRSRILSGDYPDIIDVSVVYRDALIDDRLLLDLSPYVKDSGMDMDLYFQNQFSGLMRGEALYGIPSGSLLMAAYINKDLFEQAGVEIPSTDWESSWTWDDAARAAEAIRDLSSEEKEAYGMTFSFTVGWLIPFLLSNNSDFLTEPNALCATENRETRETFTYFKDLLFDKGVSPSMMQLINLQPYQFFFEGKAGILIDGNWWMEAAEDKLDFDWGIVPLPCKQSPATGMYVDAWAVPKSSAHPKEAFDVLRFFLEREQQQSGIMKGIPALKDSAQDIYRDRFASLSEEEIRVWFDGIAYGKTPAYFKDWNHFQKESTELLQQYSLNNLEEDEFFRRMCDSYDQYRKTK